MNLVPLDSPRWQTLEASCGGTGEYAARLLTQIYEGVDTDEDTVTDALGELLQQMCHCSVGPVAFAAVPHLVVLAEQATGAQRRKFLAWVGSVIGASVSDPESVQPIPDDLAQPFELAKCRALELATAELARPISDPADSLYLLQIVAALHRHATVSNLIQSWPGYSCPMCGQEWCAPNDAYFDPAIHHESPLDSPKPPAKASAPEVQKKWWRLW
jgi:hypothetical protein